jgi:hypothetical protein
MKPDRCPVCKRGLVLEWTAGWYCARRYAKRSPCDWESGFLEGPKKMPAGGGTDGHLPDTPARGDSSARRKAILRKSGCAVNRRHT